MAAPLCVVIASPLSDEHVQRIRDVDPVRIRVVHEPALIPRPLFTTDHRGVAPDLDASDVGRWLAILGQADVLFDFDWYAPAELPSNAPRLRWVQGTSSGIGERVRAWSLDRSGITLTNCAGIFGGPLAEYVTLGLLYLARDVPRLQADQAACRWEKDTIRELGGMTVVLVGLGDLGSRIAEALAALRVEVWGLRRSEAPPPPGVARLVARDDFHRALGAADALVLACPYTPETHHLVGAAELAALPAGAFLVNVARGAVIDEPALVASLAAGHLGGAVLDVFETEPLPAESPLWRMPNVLVTPHSAANSPRENDLIVDLFTDNLRRYVDGRPLRNVYRAERAY